MTDKLLLKQGKKYAETRDRTGDRQIFSLTLSQLSYFGFLYIYAFISYVASRFF